MCHDMNIGVRCELCQDRKAMRDFDEQPAVSFKSLFTARRLQNGSPHPVNARLVMVRCKGYASHMLCGKGSSKSRVLLRRFMATVALFALLLPGLSALAETISASELQDCGNTGYCPLHHRDASTLQRDKMNCDGVG